MSRVRQAGLLERRPTYYLVMIAVNAALVTAGWTIFALVGDSWWQLATAGRSGSRRLGSARSGASSVSRWWRRCPGWRTSRVHPPSGRALVLAAAGRQGDCDRR
ncbi:hypothetical protein [Micromonospora sp. DT31]|uniref:hypothetical protein n=1 Tax=Micromonospora sp. DT31 TaxID=3393434 RepID=UPI003CEDDA66